MVQFKPYYSGLVTPPFRRAVSVQKCLRAGGKGSDLENVGRTLRHHTFFEMLGNFSFGDYFKRETIVWAWEFCTGAEGLGLPPERLWPTVFGRRDPAGGWTYDEEAEAAWKNQTGVVHPIVRLDETENFWGPAGGTGACGPCSEIKFFMGSDEELARYRELAGQGEKGLARLAQDLVNEGDLFLEIWNLVFPEFDHQPDGSRPPLKNRGIDTGAGLERVTTACQRVASDGRVLSPYETDLLLPIVERVADLAGVPYPRLAGGAAAERTLRGRGFAPAEVRLAINACADHARALTFALAEGAIPSNEGRGYVVRRILRRAARFGRKIGLEEPFLHELVEPIIEVMGETYPELKAHPNQIRRVIRLAEEQFSRTLHLGANLLEDLLEGRAAGRTLTGEEAYHLYDTHGFPLDLMIEMAEERGLSVDVEAFERRLAEARREARASWKGAGAVDRGPLVEDLRAEGAISRFLGYETLEAEGRVLALVRDDQRVEALEEGQAGLVVLDRTPFYAEGGGQVGDRGGLLAPEGSLLFAVEDTQKTDDGFVFHFGEAQGRLEVGQAVLARVEAARRWATMKNHSVTHLLQGALKRLVGPHVTQSGSYVGPDHLRFDFTHPEPLPAEALRRIEALVNEQIQNNLAVTWEEMPIEEARRTGAIAPFGEKYGARVRVVRMGEFSTEFCGGTHVRRTGEIGPFVIASEGSVAAGIRRIEAWTGLEAVSRTGRDRSALDELARTLTAPRDRLAERAAGLMDELKALRREVDRLKRKRAAGGEIPTVEIGDVLACVAWIEGADAKALREALDRLRSRHRGRKLVAVLGSGDNSRATLIIGATPELQGGPLQADRLVEHLAPLFDGSGGGKALLAQAGGKEAGKLRVALEDGRMLAALRDRVASALP